MSLRDPLGPFWYILPIDEWLIFMCKYTVRLRPMDYFLMLLQSLIFSCTISLNEWHLPLMYWFLWLVTTPAFEELKFPFAGRSGVWFFMEETFTKSTSGRCF